MWWWWGWRPQSFDPYVLLFPGIMSTMRMILLWSQNKDRALAYRLEDVGGRWRKNCSCEIPEGWDVKISAWPCALEVFLGNATGWNSKQNEKVPISSPLLSSNLISSYDHSKLWMLSIKNMGKSGNKTRWGLEHPEKWPAAIVSGGKRMLRIVFSLIL